MAQGEEINDLVNPLKFDEVRIFDVYLEEFFFVFASIFFILTFVWTKSKNKQNVLGIVFYEFFMWKK